MIFDQLKAQLLSQAIQGKLVPHFAEEGIVEQLGDVPGHVPFEIPESWKWIQLKQLAVKISDGSHNPPPNTGSGIPVLSAKNVNNWAIDFSKIDRWTDLTNWSIENKKIPLEKGDVLLTIVGTIGRAAVVNFDEKVLLQRSVCVIKQKRELINNSYLVFALSTPSIQQWLKDKASGTAQKGVYLKTLKEVFIPLPPLKAQERIVKKLETLFVEIEKAEKAYLELLQLSSVFRKTILQEAIQGKLVPELAEDGVVKQLGEEPEEVPFEIPESWKWIQLKQLAVKISDGSHNPPPNTGSGIPVLSAKNVNNWAIDFSKIDRWTDLTNWSIENKKIPLEKGDVLLTIVGTIGRAAVVNFDEKVLLQRSVCVIKQKRELINNRYLVFALSTPSIQQWLNDKASGTAQKGVYLKTLKEVFIPLPPLKAQERIVKKLDELLAQVAALNN